MGCSIDLDGNVGAEDGLRTISRAEYEALVVRMRNRCASVWASRLLREASKRPEEVADPEEHARRIAALQRIGPLFGMEATPRRSPGTLRRTVLAIVVALGSVWPDDYSSSFLPINDDPDRSIETAWIRA